MTRSNAGERLSQTFADYVTVDKKEDSNATYIVYGGYAFNKNVAVEASYIDFGKYVAAGRDWDGNSVSDSLTAKAFALNVVGILPLGDKFSIDAKIGPGIVSQKYHCEDLLCSILPDKTTRKIVVSGGVGARWHASKNFAVRLAYEHFGGAKYEIERTDGMSFSKSADYGLMYAGVEGRF